MTRINPSMAPSPARPGPDRHAATISCAAFGSLEGSETIDLNWDADSQGCDVPCGEIQWDKQPEAGQWVGRYLLIEPLGAGSQAVVWRAVDDSPPSREVALKLLTTSSASNHRGVARLRREAERGRRLLSPAILEVSDFGIADGVAYMAMPLVQGGTLADVLDWRHRRSAAVASPGRSIWLSSLPEPDYIAALAGVMARVARALQAAHEAAVVHCDIKPANILLDRRRPDRVFLSDFGMGRDLDAMTPGQRWDLSGTPRYMAPELLMGQPADGRLCDVYSLGVTMYEAVTGGRHFRCSDDDLPLVRRLAQLATQEPEPVRAVAPRVPPRLGAIIDAAMARDPMRRYPLASALADDLEAFLAGAPSAVAASV